MRVSWHKENFELLSVLEFICNIIALISFLDINSLYVRIINVSNKRYKKWSLSTA